MWTPKNYKRRKVVVKFKDPSLTDQQYKDACDINKILKKLLKKGIGPIHTDEPIYGDYSEAPDYHEAMNIIALANEQFNGLSSDLRERFNHNPEQFLDFVHNEENLEEMYRLGLADRPAPTPEVPKEVPKEKQTTDSVASD